MPNKNLYNKADGQEILDRLARLDVSSKGKWGKMSVSQMMKHLSTAFDVALGKVQLPHTQPHYSLLANPIGRWLIIDGMTWPHGTPGPPAFIIKDQPDFEEQKTALTGNIIAFIGSDNSATADHPLVGKLDRSAWGRFMYKHADHHFRQFGV